MGRDLESTLMQVINKPDQLVMLINFNFNMILKEKSVMASHLLSLVSAHAVASPNAICSAGANKKTKIVMEDCHVKWETRS